MITVFIRCSVYSKVNFEVVLWSVCYIRWNKMLVIWINTVFLILPECRTRPMVKGSLETVSNQEDNPLGLGCEWKETPATSSHRTVWGRFSILEIGRYNFKELQSHLWEILLHHQRFSQVFFCLVTTSSLDRLSCSQRFVQVIHLDDVPWIRSPENVQGNYRKLYTEVFFQIC